MKKVIVIIFLGFVLSNNAYSEIFFFKNCKLSNAVTGSYVVNIQKNVIEVELKREDGVVQNFADKIKTIESNKIISEKIKSEKSKELYYQYFLNSKTETVTKLKLKIFQEKILEKFLLLQKNGLELVNMKLIQKKEKKLWIN